MQKLHVLQYYEGKKFAQGNSRGAGAPHHNPTVVMGFCFTLNTSEISAKKLGKINS